jgi:hypothetical protein
MCIGAHVKIVEIENLEYTQRWLGAPFGCKLQFVGIQGGPV